MLYFFLTKEAAKNTFSQPRISSLFLSQIRDSNPGPTHYECVALPTEPIWQCFSCAQPVIARFLCKDSDKLNLSKESW